MIEWLKILLEHEGYEVRTAMIGTRGEEIFKTWKPDVVITDMMLPDVDGLDLLRRFKQTHGDTEVIVVTGHGSVPKAVEAMKAGAHSFVEKPIEPDTLLAVLERAIEPRPDGREPAAEAEARRSSGSATSSVRARRCTKCSSWWKRRGQRRTF